MDFILGQGFDIGERTTAWRVLARAEIARRDAERNKALAACR